MKFDKKSEIERRINYLEQALTPGSSVNVMTTFYKGKGEEMRKELAALKAEVNESQ